MVRFDNNPGPKVQQESGRERRAVRPREANCLPDAPPLRHKILCPNWNVEYRDADVGSVWGLIRIREPVMRDDNAYQVFTDLNRRSFGAKTSYSRRAPLYRPDSSHDSSGSLVRPSSPMISSLTSSARMSMARISFAADLRLKRQCMLLTTENATVRGPAAKA
jgi:hypothetical protein